MTFKVLSLSHSCIQDDFTAEAVTCPVILYDVMLISKHVVLKIIGYNSLKSFKIFYNMKLFIHDDA